MAGVKEHLWEGKINPFCKAHARQVQSGLTDVLQLNEIETAAIFRSVVHQLGDTQSIQQRQRISKGFVRGCNDSIEPQSEDNIAAGRARLMHLDCNDIITGKQIVCGDYERTFVVCVAYAAAGSGGVLNSAVGHAKTQHLNAVDIEYCAIVNHGEKLKLCYIVRVGIEGEVLSKVVCHRAKRKRRVLGRR